MQCTGTVWEGDSFALEFSDQALLEDQFLITPNDETKYLKPRILYREDGTIALKFLCVRIAAPIDPGIAAG